MKKFEIHLADWQRILFGQAPPMFLLEVFIRSVIIYIFLLLVLRWLGKRMSGQLTILEMAVMLTLGAIVSVAMQTPDRGITLSMFVLLCTLLFQRGLSRWGLKNARIEELSQGKISTLLKNGVFNLDEMRSCRISRQQLLAELRGKGILNLGDVSRVYLEACGVFTTIKAHVPVAGLPTTPPDDKQVLNLLHHSNDLACVNCGYAVAPQNVQKTCPRCGANTWTAAVTS
ncbi:DUF421 domain-containing protein [Mucilaginibacter sp. RCC_168]|uniref:DUF421 domain-containing protein n=1 Tax=Mucilaginibacter sp. RCC_168 TaxID=3239221 RepID=UPI003525287F